MKRRSKKSRPARRRGRNKAGLAVLLSLIGAVALLAVLVVATKEAPLKHLAGQVAMAFGERGSARGAMDSPRGVAVDPRDGSIYVVDLSNSRINKYSADGKFILSWGKKGERGPNDAPAKAGDFNEPSGIAVDQAGNVYVADSWNGRIQKFDSKGRFLAQYGGAAYSFYSPRNVACDTNGNIYVADTGNSKVQVFGPDGGRLKVLGERGRRKGLFDEVFGLAVNSKGEFFAADPGNGTIHKYSALPEAKLVDERKVPGWKRNRPFWPMLAVDKEDRVYAVDNNNRQVWVYDANLNYLGTLGGEPNRDYFGSPLGVALTPKDELLVVDMAKGSVVKFNPLAFPTAK